MAERDVDRPVGVAILAWLQMVCGGACLVIGIMLLLTAKDYRQEIDVMASIGIPTVMLGPVTTLIGALSLSAGIGMWLGKRWGWFLSALLFAYGVSRNFVALLTIPGLIASMPTEVIAEITHGPAYYYFKHVTRVIVQGLLYLYFFRKNVQAYFDVKYVRKWKPVAIQWAACVVVVGLCTLSARLIPDRSTDFLTMQQLFLAGDYEAAVRQGRDYVEHYPDSAIGFSQLGWAYVQLGAVNQAEECFRNAIDADATMDNAHVGLGVVLRNQGDLDGARRCYEKAIALEPHNPQALSSLSVIELMQHNDAKALQYAQRAWRLKSRDPILAANLAVAYHYAGNIEQRDAMYQEAKQLGCRDIERLDEIFTGKLSIR